MAAIRQRSVSPSFEIVQAPHRKAVTQPSLFLGGSIINNWQKKLSDSLLDLPITILNPLRKDWEAIGPEDISNPSFREQTDWELDMQIKADLVVAYFAPETQAPISLLELGLATVKGPEKVLVCCPKGYWKKGNVDVVCSRFGIRVFGNLEELTEAVREKMKGLCDVKI